MRSTGPRRRESGSVGMVASATSVGQRTRQRNGRRVALAGPRRADTRSRQFPGGQEARAGRRTCAGPRRGRRRTRGPCPRRPAWPARGPRVAAAGGARPRQRQLDAVGPGPGGRDREPAVEVAHDQPRAERGPRLGGAGAGIDGGADQRRGGERDRGGDERADQPAPPPAGDEHERDGARDPQREQHVRRDPRDFRRGALAAATRRSGRRARPRRAWRRGTRTRRRPGPGRARSRFQTTVYVPRASVPSSGTTICRSSGWRSAPVGTGLATPSSTCTVAELASTGSVKRSTTSFGASAITASPPGVVDSRPAWANATAGSAARPPARRSSALTARPPARRARGARASGRGRRRGRRRRSPRGSARCIAIAASGLPGTWNVSASTRSSSVRIASIRPATRRLRLASTISRWKRRSASANAASEPIPSSIARSCAAISSSSAPLRRSAASAAASHSTIRRTSNSSSGSAWSTLSRNPSEWSSALPAGATVKLPLPDERMSPWTRASAAPRGPTSGRRRRSRPARARTAARHRRRRRRTR